MRRLWYPEEVRDLDSRAIRELGLPGIALMECAGAEAARVVRERYGPARACERAVRPGNNGGDGFVVARHLHVAGVAAGVCIDAAAQSTTPDASTMRAAATAFGVPERRTGGCGRDRRRALRQRLPRKARGGCRGARHAGERARRADRRARRAERGRRRERPRRGSCHPGRADARVPRTHARHRDRARARHAGRGRRAADRPADRARRPAARRAHGAPPTSRSCRGARRPGRSTTRAACSSSAARPA